MISLIKKNVNPKGRKTGDCSTRALVSTLNIDYNTCAKMQLEKTLKYYYDFTSKQTVEKVLADFGYVKMKQPRKSNGLKFKIGELDLVLNNKKLKHNILITCSHHHTCVDSNYNVVDTWDCRNKTILNYYIHASDLD